MKTLRQSAGLTQDQLAGKAGLNLRTIQRIENGDSVPRGDTLHRIARALQVNLADITESKDQAEQELLPDKGYLHLLNASILTILISPVLWVILPLIVWIIRKGKSQVVDETGKKVLNFQLTMILLFLFLFMIIPGLAHTFFESAIAYRIMSETMITPEFLYGIAGGVLPTGGGLVTLLMVWISVMAAWNAWRIEYNKGVHYIPFVPFHKYISRLRNRMPASSS
ncbi:helix-turn-helix domain-containing protein [Natronogracilivirga saccharolytica]|uniref:helix-turn-helix domain-containing protein n=1 Tax=Natronogracilivirga saccharolytica TaxID=2812953 RepID=UPI00300C4F2F